MSSGTTLVLGGSGFLGAHVVAQAGSEVVVAGREEGPEKALRAGSPRAKFRKLDALAPGQLELVLDSVRPAKVILCTALSSVADAEKYPGLARALNVEFPRLVAVWCARSRARLVHVSTDLVFGGNDPPPGGFCEEDPPAPLSEYGRSKSAGESAVLQAHPKALVVRLPLLYGDSFGRDRGASDSLLSAIARGERPTLFTDEWRTPLDVANAARALVELAETDASGLLHVAGPDRVSRYELGLLVLRSREMDDAAARAAIRPATRAEAGLEATRARDASLDSRRSRSLLSTPLLCLQDTPG
ncbi:MAG: SDR family oxidoreductase [Planctomycetota bacterium]